jgi:hypothetical protein
MEHDKKIKPETPDYIRFNNKILRKEKATQLHHPPTRRRPPTGDAHPPNAAIPATPTHHSIRYANKTKSKRRLRQRPPTTPTHRCPAQLRHPSLLVRPSRGSGVTHIHLLWRILNPFRVTKSLKG